MKKKFIQYIFWVFVRVYDKNVWKNKIFKIYSIVGCENRKIF